jgi:hypothetical protein
MRWTFPKSGNVYGRGGITPPNYMLVWMAGFFIFAIASASGLLLDQGAVLGFGLALAFFPCVINIALAPRRHSGSKYALVQRIYIWTGVVLLALTASTLMNVVLDKYPPERIQTHVVRKYASLGRYGTGYRLVVSPSWRQGRKQEDLRVNEQTYRVVSTGETVRVVAHRGAFGLPWYSGVLPGID